MTWASVSSLEGRKPTKTCPARQGGKASRALLRVVARTLILFPPIDIAAGASSLNP
jgi:hypothetical protein